MSVIELRWNGERYALVTGKLPDVAAPRGQRRRAAPDGTAPPRRPMLKVASTLSLSCPCGWRVTAEPLAGDMFGIAATDRGCRHQLKGCGRAERVVWMLAADHRETCEGVKAP